MKRWYRLPTLLGLLLLLLGIGGGILLVQRNNIFRLSASSSQVPQEIRVTNITDSSFVVSWRTLRPTLGFVFFGTGGETSSSTPVEKKPGKLHYHILEKLSPQTQYSFKIAADGRIFENNGSPYQIKTGPTLPSVREADVVFGDIVDESGQAASYSIIYASIADASPISQVTDKNGQWIINLALARSTTLSSYAQYDRNQPLQLFIQGEDQFATVKILPKDARPVPTITLGKTYDFTQGELKTSEDVPSSNINVPEKGQEVSRFSIDEEKK